MRPTDERRPAWFQDWSQHAAVIVAGGPSVSQCDLPAGRALPGLKWVAINKAHEIVPWAHLLFACDRAWWQVARGASTFGGLRVAHDAQVGQWFPGVQTIKCRKDVNSFMIGPPWHIGWGANGGFQSMNIALQFGCRRMVLVGFDMNVDGGLHWHGPHVKQLNNPKPESVKRWRRILDAQRPFLDTIGAEVVIGSPGSSLTAYQKMDFHDALGWASNFRG